jgi:PiT family inorganic phosphate transporter
LIGTCSLVSFFHGSNDGQKGLGLMMIILMTFMPLQFSLNEKFGDTQTIEHLDNIQKILTNYKTSSPLEKEFNNTISNIDLLKTDIYNNKDSTAKQKFEIRKRIQVITKSLEIIVKDPEFLPNKSVRDEIKSEIKFMKSYTDWAPNWAIMLIALSIGIGTMIGWKRIVVTIGEKIGKSHLSYGQGAVSELVAASTIGLSTTLGLPVSTTHVLSSAIAGSMVAKGGVKNLQKNTIKSIAIAWLLTLPVSIILALSFFLLFRLFI